MDIKTNVALNLIKYRKILNLTQADLAEKLNYSDKAVSKWERMESVPDIFILHQIATLFGITVDELISPPTEKKPSILKKIIQNKVFKGLIGVCIVWLVAILFFTLTDLVFPFVNQVFPLWLFFIYAIPISFLVLRIVWKKGVTKLVFSSLLVWGIIIALYFSVLKLLPKVPTFLWEVFLVGVPIQAILIFLFFYKKNPLKRKKNKI